MRRPQIWDGRKIAISYKKLQHFENPIWPLSYSYAGNHSCKLHPDGQGIERKLNLPLACARFYLPFRHLHSANCADAGIFSIFTKSLYLNMRILPAHVRQFIHVTCACAYSFFNQWNFLENKLSITCRQF